MAIFAMVGANISTIIKVIACGLSTRENLPYSGNKPPLKKTARASTMEMA